MAKQCSYLCVLLAIMLLIACSGAYFLSTTEVTKSVLENKGKEAFSLLAHWAQGNVVALIRHAERCDRSETPCLEGDSGITVPGKDMAIRLGRDFEAILPLDDTVIYHSPVKRTEQTAKFMFGSASSERKWLREGCEKNLLKDIFRNKEDGENLVLVTHATCIDPLGEADGDKLIRMDMYSAKTYGITVFLAIDKQTAQAYALGYLYPQDWENMPNWKGRPAL